MATNLTVNQLYKDEPSERLINRFFKKYRESEIYDEYKKYSFYEKPSTKKHRKKSKALHINDIW